jgi:hypothetical protein
MNPSSCNRRQFQKSAVVAAGASALPLLALKDASHPFRWEPAKRNT